MVKLLWLVALACVAWRMYSGRWPWEKKRKVAGPSFEAAQARALLGVEAGADRREIVEAHRRRIAQVHPDRGGSSEQVHQANAARDLLLALLPVEG
ncbi:J domain-containing protein [Novosphingobium kaempferiae]|uniref:J domain-containing protein n=1 Tax=Novosphingobium kaempferiae TaxID=2896849 RepID=UPI001E2C87DF|nr:J domain-containing protein [Novosphingobium kaempferiae]